MSQDSNSHNQQAIPVFPGFEPLTANYVYCPNQFFDVCLPNCSRGAVRVVAYVLRETLGWLDQHGNPLRQDIEVSYRDLILKAGVSRGLIGAALQEAMTTGFIECRQTAQAKSSGRTSQSGVYSLRWNRRSEYTTAIRSFNGFYSGEGHRTPVSNRFFDDLVPTESLSVIKMVGTVFRQTVGYQNQFGGRRTEHPLSYNFIQKNAHIGGRANLAKAIRRSMEMGYVHRTIDGVVHPRSSNRKPASYSIRWLQKDTISHNGSKTKPATSDRFKNETSVSSQSKPARQFKNETNKKTDLNNIQKQQVVVLLKQTGLDEMSAQRLADKRGLAAVKNQIAWLDARNPDNPVAMLYRAIDEDWDKPHNFAQRERRESQRRLEKETEAKAALEEAAMVQIKKTRNQRKQQLLDEWHAASLDIRRAWIQEALEHETSARIADLIRREAAESDNPRVQILDAIAVDRNLPRVVQVNNQ